MEEDFLTMEMIKKALASSSDLPPLPDPIIIHSSVWDNYKLAFHLTEEQMKRYFIKSVYLS